nr:Protein Y62E10A.19 [Haemonchus contortus]
MIHLIWILANFLVFITHVIADPPFLFPHGYFDSRKLKPFDAIYLNMMAQSNLEYGGVTLEDLDKLDKTRELVNGPPASPRDREEVNVLPYYALLPLDTDAIAPGPKNSYYGGPQDSFSSLARDHSSSGGKARDGEARLKTTQPPTPLESTMALGYRRAVEDDGNPFEEIATRPPPRSEVQMQRVRYYLRRHRKPKKKRRRNFLTRDDIYDPERNERSRMTKEERRRLREELALKPTSDEAEDSPVTNPKEAQEELVRLQRPVHTGGREGAHKDFQATPQPDRLPTLIPTMDRLPRLRNNPFQSIDISGPTVISLPIPPNIDEELERHR